MKNYLVVGNPIEHSYSPQLHNYWIKRYGINANYKKVKLETDDLKNLISEIKNKKVDGINVTVPFKREIIPYLDKLSSESKDTQSVNTIFLKDNEVFGHNTDIEGFQLAIKESKYDISKKRIFIIGAGGVVPSIIYALNKMNTSNIMITNRTFRKVENLKNTFPNLIIVDWGKVPDFDMVINATSLGLSSKDQINLDFSNIERNKFFYDIIYNPKETEFLKRARELGNKTDNGAKMFIYQAAAAFKIWHGIKPEINEDVIKLLG